MKSRAIHLPRNLPPVPGKKTAAARCGGLSRRAVMLSALTLMGAALYWLPGPVRASAQVGQPAPVFAGTDSQGRVHRLADYRGKTVVLEWTNHDCPYVRKHYGSGNMQQLQRQAAADGVVWLTVIS